MQFEGRYPVYLQIVEHICEQIISGQWQEQEALPAVQEMAVALRVNPNTVTRAYQYLQQAGIIDAPPDRGYRIEIDASQKIQRLRRAQFISTDVPELLRKLKMLGMSFGDLEQLYRQYEQIEHTSESPQSTGGYEEVK